MKRLFLSIIVISICMMSVNVSIAQQWTQALIFSEDGVVQDSLFFGIDPFGTDGIDASLGEVELPPKPVAGVFDVRFTGPVAVLGNGLKNDIRLTSTDTKEYTIDIQRAAGGEISISWGTLQAGTFVMQDLLGGLIFNVDMTTTNQATITNAAITQIKVIVTPEIGEIINNPPTFVTTSLPDAVEGVAYTDTLKATDPDANDVLTFVIITSPSWLSTNSAGVLSGTPGATDIGSSEVSISVTDFRGLSDTLNTTITVKAKPITNRPPVFVTTFLNDAFAGRTYRDTLQAEDPDFEDVLVFTKLSGPEWLKVSSSGLIGGLPRSSDLGVGKEASVLVTDLGGLKDTLNTTINVLEPPDRIPPRFLGLPIVLSRDTNFVTIGWLTDEVSTSVIEYETVDRFPTSQISVSDSSLTKNHKLTITGLKSATKYEYIIKSVDAQGNEAVSSRSFRFKTAKNADIEPPIIFGNPRAAERDTDRVTIRWNTNEISTSIVEIAIDSVFAIDSLRTTVSDAELTKDHSVTVLNLRPDTRYAYRVGSVDAVGNGPTYSKIREVKTRKAADNKPPVIFGKPEVHPIDTSTVIIVWKTDEISNSRVNFYSDQDVTNISSTEDQTFTVDHAVVLTGLSSGAKYTNTGNTRGYGTVNPINYQITALTWPKLSVELRQAIVRMVW
ncbi:fibronectin type III domain-containing protein [candidate division KSB1 bacterium]|nr:fibronectin type III domain-containing protein [candidate division KSB1 bacterium]